MVKCWNEALKIPKDDPNVVKEVHKDLDRSRFEALLNQLRKEKTKPLLVWLYYSGHGCLSKLDQLTVATCVDGKNYPLERKMRDLSGFKDVHVVCIFDCCRAEELIRIQRPTNSRKQKQTPRYTMTYAVEEGKE